MACTIHIVQRMAPGGIESIVLDLAMADPDLHVISLEGTREALVARWPVLAPLGSRLHAFDKREGWHLALWLAMAKLFRRLRPDALVTHHIGPMVYGGIAGLIGRVGRMIHVEHDGWHYAQPRRRVLARLLDRLLAPRRVAVSHVTATQVAKALGTLRQTVIPNGVDLARFRIRDPNEARAAFGLPLGCRMIGCIGRLETVKGQDRLIRAMATLEGDIHLVLAGDGSQRSVLEALANQLGLAGRVHFLGQVSDPERLYPAFDLFCLPSRAEGFPRSLIEAQACGIPVIASDVGGSREAVCPQTGWLVPAGDDAALAASLTAAFEQTFTASPRAFADPAFSNALMMARYRALLSA